MFRLRYWPSAVLTIKIAPSIWAAPVIIFFIICNLDNLWHTVFFQFHIQRAVEIVIPLPFLQVLCQLIVRCELSSTCLDNTLVIAAVNEVIVYVSNCSNITMWFWLVEFFDITFYLILNFNFGAYESNPTSSLGQRSTIEHTRIPKLILQVVIPLKEWWRGRIHPRRPKSTFLQSVLFDRFCTPPKIWGMTPLIKALNNMGFIYFYWQMQW